MAQELFKYIDYTPSHYEDSNDEFRVGNSMFKDELWDFKNLIPGSATWPENKCWLKFDKFKSTSIKNTIKWFMVTELIANGFTTVKRKLAALHTFDKFIQQNEDITSFEDISKYRLEEFFNFVLSDTKDNGEPTSAVSKKKAAQVVKEILERGAVRGWEVPSNTNHVELLYNSMIIENNNIKSGTKFGKSNKVLPEKDIVSHLITTALEVLENGQDSEILTAASIIISSQIGCRIEEVLSIQKGCLSQINGEMFITFISTKINNEPTEVNKPANKEVCIAIDKLEEYTEPLRKESGLPYLFLSRNRSKAGHPVTVASKGNWTKNRLTPFIQKYDLRDEKGNLLKLTSHYFRHICATYAYRGGLKTHDVAELLGHNSIMMTETYNHTEDKQQVVKDILSGDTPIATTNKIVLKQLEGDENPFKGKTIEQIEKLRRALKIELLPHGICTHHPMRGEPCEQDGACLGCSNFLASSKHLPVYEKRLERVNEELEVAGNDNSIWTSKLYYQHGKLEYYIQELSKKMANKEFQKAMSEVEVSKDDE